MKLSLYAHQMRISYRTVFRWFKSGKLQGYQMDTSTILITELIDLLPRPEHALKVAIYTRVSAAGNKDNLESRAQRLRDYGAAKGYPVALVIKEIGSGVKDTRPKLLRPLTDPTIQRPPDALQVPLPGAVVADARAEDLVHALRAVL